jgi:hypothetical protein
MFPIGGRAGDAVGGGAELSTATDFRVMASHAGIAFVHPRMGLVPGWGGARRLGGIVGGRRALRLAGSAVRTSAADACAAGLVDEVFESGGGDGGGDAAVAAARGFLAPFLDAPAPVLRGLKRALCWAPGAGADNVAAGGSSGGGGVSSCCCSVRCAACDGQCSSSSSTLLGTGGGGGGGGHEPEWRAAVDREHREFAAAWGAEPHLAVMRKIAERRKKASSSPPPPPVA